MSNKLIKNTKVSYVAGSPYVPGNPGQPGHPSYVGVVTSIVCRASGAVVAAYTPVDAYNNLLQQAGTSASALANALSLDLGSNTPALGTLGGRSSLPITWACTPQTSFTLVPAAPYIPPTPATQAVPAQTIIDYGLGWTANAVSIASVYGDGYAAFDSPATAIGAVVGVVNPSVALSYSSPDHALTFSHGAVRVVESGVQVASLGVSPSTDRWLIRCRRGVVTYEQNGTVVYTSAAVAPSSFVMAAVLYSGGDYVVNPAISALTTVTMTMRPLALSAGTGTSHSSAKLSFQPLVVLSRAAVRAALAFQPLVIAGGRAGYTSVKVAMQPLQVVASGGFATPSYGLASLSTAFMTMGAHGFTGGLFDGNLSFQPMQINASVGNRANARVAFRPMLAGGSAYEGNFKATVFALLGAVDAQVASAQAVAVISSNFTVAGVLTISLNATAMVKSSLTLSSTLTQLMQQIALMQSNVTFSGTQPVFGAASSAWAVNYDTQAASRYEQFDFNSMGAFQGAYFGVKASGIYQLDGSDDAGTPVASMVSFGKQTFGSSMKKRMTNAYIGVSSSGTMYLKIIADTVEYIYQSRRDGDGFMTTTRFDIGKGIRANYLEFELYNGTGADFELESVEFLAVPTDRRI